MLNIIKAPLSRRANRVLQKQIETQIYKKQELLCTYKRKQIDERLLNFGGFVKLIHYYIMLRKEQFRSRNGLKLLNIIAFNITETESKQSTKRASSDISNNNGILKLDVYHVHGK